MKAGPFKIKAVLHSKLLLYSYVITVVVIIPLGLIVGKLLQRSLDQLHISFAL